MPVKRRQRIARPPVGQTDPLQLLRTQDVCALLRISKPTLWRWRRTADFPQAYELGPLCVAWRRAEIEGWLQQRRRR